MDEVKSRNRNNAMGWAFAGLALLLTATGCGDDGNNQNDPFKQAFDIEAASVTYYESIDALVFEQRVAGIAGSQTPTPAGQLNGAPVLGYVFPTSLKPSDVGFGDVEPTAVAALAVTSHPDFDDTPLWDENRDGDYGNDGIRYHTHWVVLVKDMTAPGGWSVRAKSSMEKAPPTGPMPDMMMDSPGFAMMTREKVLRVVVPRDRVNGKTSFQFDALTARMKVTEASGVHKLTVEEVFEVLSKDLSLPQSVQTVAGAIGIPSTSTDFAESFNIEAAAVKHIPDLDLLAFTMSVKGQAATQLPMPAGGLNGAPILAYVFTTNLRPTEVGFPSGVDGLVALAVTVHPDFEDTPLWDENNDGIYDNDKASYHVHWVLLEAAPLTAPAGFRIVGVMAGQTLMPTAPMPDAMMMDSPGFSAVKSGNTLRVLVPLDRVRGNKSLKFDAVTARLEVDATGMHPRVNMTQIFEVLSGDISSIHFDVTTHVEGMPY